MTTPLTLIERHTVAVYRSDDPAALPIVPFNEDAHRVEITVRGIQFVWKRNADGSYRRWAGPIGWLADEFERELLGERQ